MAWWLAYEELYGDMDKEYPIMSKKDKDVVTFPVKDGVVTFGSTTISTAAGNDTIEIKSNYDWDDDGFSVTGNPFASADTLNLDFSGIGSVYGAADTVTFTGSHLLGGMGNDHIDFSGFAGTAYDDNKYYAEGYDPYPPVLEVDPDLFASMDGDPTVGGGNTASESDGLNLNVDPDLTVGVAETLNLNINTKPQPDLTKSHKYEEDKGIKDLKDYVASTYSGHYTSKNNNVQTLDLIQSVGDAESFCRSNAIKYLSRYDKRGQAKRDILKAMHYCLLLYYFSGQTQEDTTQHGYETF